MSNTQLIYIRTAATATITALAVLYSYYPNDVWITTIMAAAGAVGIHAIPAIQQGVTQLIPVSVKKGTATVSEQPQTTPEVASDVAPAGNPATEIDGMALMGLRAPVTDSGQAEAAVTPEPTPEPVAASEPVSEPANPTVVGVTVHLSDGTSKTF